MVSLAESVLLLLTVELYSLLHNYLSIRYYSLLLSDPIRSNYNRQLKFDFTSTAHRKLTPRLFDCLAIFRLLFLEMFLLLAKFLHLRWETHVIISHAGLWLFIYHEWALFKRVDCYESFLPEIASRSSLLYVDLPPGRRICRIVAHLRIGLL